MESSFRNRKITCEQFIAGALLKFESIDNIDISLLAQGIQEKLGVQITGIWSVCFNSGDLASSIDCDKNIGTFALSERKRRNVITEEEKRCLENKLRKAAGETVVDYFSRFYKPGHKEKKQKMLKKYSMETLKNARVLLVSNSKKDYDNLVNQGFRKINWIRIGNVANDFYNLKPNLLEMHDIVIVNRECILEKNYSGATPIMERVKELAKQQQIALLEIDRDVYNSDNKVKVWIFDTITGRIKLETFKDGEDISSAIREAALVNRLLDVLTDFDNFVSIANYDLKPIQNKYEVRCGYDSISENLQYFVDKKGRKEVIVGLPNEYYIYKCYDGSIYIRGIYDGQPRVIPIYKQENGQYTSLEHTNPRMLTLFVKEVSDLLRKYHIDKDRQKRKDDKRS